MKKSPLVGVMILFIVIFWLALFILSAGCGATSRLGTAAKSAPAFLFKSPEKTVTQSGLASSPAAVSTASTVTEIPMPPGSSVTINAPAADPFNPPTTPPPVVRVTDRREQITAPTAYAPPAGPTASEQADADAVTRSYWFAGVLALVAALCAWRAHVKAAVVFGLGALAVVPLTKFISSTAGQIVVIAAVCIGGTLFAAWHFIRDRHPDLIK